MAIVLGGLAVMLAMAACGDGDADEMTTTPTSSTAPSTESILPTTTLGDDTSEPPAIELTNVIVQLAVEWRPEPDLGSEEAIASQRAAIAEMQKRVVEILQGTEFEVVEAYEVTPQMALAVDSEALSRLSASDLIASVGVDNPEAPTG